MKPITTFDEFWIYYLRQHRHHGCRALHYLGTAATLAMMGLSIAVTPWLLLLVPVVGYAPAWIGHFLIEKNKPATFGHPLWAAIADYRMFWLWMTGRLGKRLQAALAEQTAPITVPPAEPAPV